MTYAEGYRAPALTETLVSGIDPSIPQFTLLPNPGLQPEIGKTKEFGVNLRYNDVLRAGDQFRAKFNIYRNDVTNYIDLKYLGPFQTGQSGQRCLNLVAFFCEQYQNIPQRRVFEGIEFETSYDAGAWFAAWPVPTMCADATSPTICRWRPSRPTRSPRRWARACWTAS